MVQSMDSTVEKSSGCICGSHNPPSMLVQQQQLHKILDNFFHKGLIEEMTSYDNPHSVLEIHPLPLTRLNSTTQPIYLF